MRCFTTSLRSSGDAIPNCLVAIRSVFSTCNALCQGGLLTLLDFPPSVCYPSGHRWQRRGPKPGEQRNLDLRIGRESASRHDDCQHQGGRGPAVRGKVNPDEVLIKGESSANSTEICRITPARKFRMLLHTNPTRERGECLETRAGASEDL